MAPSPSGSGARKTVTYLVTGANSGLGFAICCRIIDEFLQTRPQSESLYLLYSTRDAKKSEDTLKRLNAHFQQSIQAADAKTPGASLLLEPRVKLEGVQVDLTKLTTVKALAQQLLKRRQRIDGVVWNAGIPGWLHLDWVKAIPQFFVAPVRASTYPDFMVCNVGALAPRQLAGYGKVHTFDEPRLAEVFTANVFGHYLLTHWLSPLMGPESRIVWVGSVSAMQETFKTKDLQGFTSTMAYEGSKRLIDLLVLTSELASTSALTSAFLPSASSGATTTAPSKPKMYVVHPGVVRTSISGLNAFLTVCMIIVMYLVQLSGSPWHPNDPYKGAISAVYALLSSQVPAMEGTDGKAKWGSASSPFGGERVARTEVDGWGYTGVVGQKAPAGAVLAKHPNYPGAVTKESRERFEADGREVWAQMEALRREWEARLGKIEVDEKTAVVV